MMNSDQTPQPTERVDIGNRLSKIWSSRGRIARIALLTTGGLVIQGCCIVIPLVWSAGGP